MKNGMSWIKVLSVNIFVLLGLLITAEVGSRIAWTAYQCYYRACDFSRMLNLKIFDSGSTEKNIGLSTYNEFLGYIPTAAFSAIINTDGWQNVLVTIDRNGFRSNGNNSTDLNKKSLILTVGDSFTFGDQVSDTETWPSCIELKTNQETLNAGVFGYGTAQAVRRASFVTRRQNIETVILSVLVNNDFHRDRLRFRSGFPRPAVIRSEQGLSYADVPPIDSSGTNWQPNGESAILSNFSHYSYLLTKVIPVIGIDVTGMRRTETHENAADLGQVIHFAVREFSNLDATNKFIVLQYSQTDFPNLQPEVVQLKEQLLSEARLESIPVIDTYNRLQLELSNNSNDIWNSHHTAYGNALVCDEIYQVIHSYQ